MAVSREGSAEAVGPEEVRLMRRALRLAARGLGRTSPNPVVGALVVQHGRVLATGYHRRAGLDHAEVAALRKLGGRAPGADLYVTLEPCDHHGRTPPCTQTVIDAGVRRVFVGMRDPHPLVNGRGIARLRRAGLEVIVGVAEEECRRLNESFVCVHEHGRPFVAWKAAVTLDGRIATRRGDARWVTGAAARAIGHELRDTYDAILVGARTVSVDDPRLTTRLGRGRGRDPVRVVVDGGLRTPPTARLLRSGSAAPTIIAGTRGAPSARQRRLVRAGAEVLMLPGRGAVRPRALLGALLRRGILSVLIEGGGETAAPFFAAGLVDKVVLFVAPKLLGGDGVPAIGPLGLRRMEQAIRLEGLAYRRVGEDAMITGYVHRDH
jgi:diaminohydroxyphosphoribosylaminopyrimidine deaminase/5-amino-6-(5-phosphoribosylamino)uracil reductase